jgi:hypothetical protein
LQNPTQTNGDNMNNVQRETSTIFKNKKRKYLYEKLIELAINGKREKYQGLTRRHKI